MCVTIPRGTGPAESPEYCRILPLNIDWPYGVVAPACYGGEQSRHRSLDSAIRQARRGMVAGVKIVSMTGQIGTLSGKDVKWQEKPDGWEVEE